ncbi:hypothetical protein Ddye_004029 [Dipteronia dyeriana]|uniref:Uncharacterized protein n=1 Tax=Dipteronia dyeriana TaxID=168575 RepID=A0AAE0CVX8_9ROSI|nr:hypothetical protein Ddye_004029 [Dipteronia dyeriana]
MNVVGPDFRTHEFAEKFIAINSCARACYEESGWKFLSFLLACVVLPVDSDKGSGFRHIISRSLALLAFFFTPLDAADSVTALQVAVDLMESARVCHVVLDLSLAGIAKDQKSTFFFLFTFDLLFYLSLKAKI